MKGFENFTGKVLVYEIQHTFGNYKQETVFEFPKTRKEARLRLEELTKKYKIIKADYYIVIDGISEKHHSFYI